MKRSLLFGTLTAACLMGALLVPAAHAQEEGGAKGNAAPPPSAAQTVTLDVRDAPLRQVLIQLFQKANRDYALDPAVQGFVTLKVTDQPFENILKLVMRSASTPLTYTVTNGVYEIKPRTVLPPQSSAPSLSALPPEGESVFAGDNGRHLAVIPLTYLDPFDVQGLLGVTLVPSGTRGGAGATGQPSGGPNIGSGLGSGPSGSGNVGTLGNNGSGARIISGNGNGANRGRPGR